MKITLLATALTVALGTVDAVRINVYRYGVFNIWYTTLINNDGDEYYWANFRTGCRRGEYDWLEEICMDEPKGRAHVKYTSGRDYCFLKRSGAGVYDEAPCTWPI
jgi:hypothetical protein